MKTNMWYGIFLTPTLTRKRHNFLTQVPSSNQLKWGRYMSSTRKCTYLNVNGNGFRYIVRYTITSVKVRSNHIDIPVIMSLCSCHVCSPGLSKYRWRRGVSNRHSATASIGTSKLQNNRYLRLLSLLILSIVVCPYRLMLILNFQRHPRFSQHTKLIHNVSPTSNVNDPSLPADETFNTNAAPHSPHQALQTSPRFSWKTARTGTRYIA